MRLQTQKKQKKYFFNYKVFSDGQPGSPITFKGSIFLIKKIKIHGKILQAEPGKILQYNLQNSGKHPSISVVTDEISSANGVTTLSISDNVGAGEGAEKRYSKSQKGWDKILGALKNWLKIEDFSAIGSYLNITPSLRCGCYDLRSSLQSLGSRYFAEDVRTRFLRFTLRHLCREAGMRKL